MATELIKLNDIVILVNEDDFRYENDAPPVGIFGVARDVTESMPWVKNEINLKNYLKSLFVEEFIYEKYAQRHCLNNPYIWGGDMFTEDARFTTKYLNSGIYSDSEENDIYIRLSPHNSLEGYENTDEIADHYLLEFIHKPEEVSSQDCICCFNIFDKLPIKRIINIERLFNSGDIKPKNIMRHVLNINDEKFNERKHRLPEDYQSLNLNILQERLEEDISYSLDVLHKCPYLAVPITTNDQNNNEKDMIKYVGQFAIPLYSKRYNSVYAALPLSCKDAVPEIGKYKGELDKIEKYRDALSSLDVDVYLSYCFCSYTCKTILTLDMVRDDCLFTLHGNNISPNLWFNNKKLKGVVKNNEHTGGLCIDSNGYSYNLEHPLNLEVNENVWFNAIPKFYNKANGKLRWVVSSIYSTENASSSNSGIEE